MGPTFFKCFLSHNHIRIVPSKEVHIRNVAPTIVCTRYLAICHGLRCRVTGNVARVSIVLIWTFAVAVMSPWAVFYQQNEHRDQQQQQQPPPQTANTSHDVTAQTPQPVYARSRN